MKTLRVTGLVLAFTTLLGGCGGSHAFISYAGKMNGQPVFCLSEKADCAAPGASIPALEVEEVDASDRVVRVMWRIEAPAGGTLDAFHQITYGTGPAGWAVTNPARPLTPGAHYRVNKQFYFSLTHNGLILTEDKPTPRACCV